MGGLGRKLAADVFLALPPSPSSYKENREYQQKDAGDKAVRRGAEQLMRAFRCKKEGSCGNRVNPPVKNSGGPEAERPLAKPEDFVSFSIGMLGRAGCRKAPPHSWQSTPPMSRCSRLCIDAPAPALSSFNLALSSKIAIIFHYIGVAGKRTLPVLLAPPQHLALLT